MKNLKENAHHGLLCILEITIGALLLPCRQIGQKLTDLPCMFLLSSFTAGNMDK